MISEFVDESAWIMPPPCSLLDSLSLFAEKLESRLPEPPVSGLLLLPEPEAPRPLGSGGVPDVPVDIDELPRPPPLLPKEFELELEPDVLSEPLPLPIMPRSVLARRVASALRSATTCMLPGCVVGASSFCASCFAAARRAAL